MIDKSSDKRKKKMKKMGSFPSQLKLSNTNKKIDLSRKKKDYCYIIISLAMA